ncbi:pyridoxal-phosphate dependent enzyme [Phyllobacterium lublinensis]|uniref:pyridoxal-phosphate dependent enzyme n=1 Tax=Phyllobacterium lublinensis TaxID=2875708 RepID=UPI001CCA7FDE|nr:pyridoxal-phosphate dependent enzyme [Phyllobacterium sp. 2063]MBZ9653159.1 pyridoxal-phosphate dependent enzyme [Phyllobacterium sp. 2063]
MAHAAGFVAKAEVVDRTTRKAAVACARGAGVVLPTFAELAGTLPLPRAINERLADVDPDQKDPSNLWRVHWFNARDRRHRTDVPDHIVLSPALTGVSAPIVVLIGSRFPMIGAHKVLPAYAGLVSLLVTGQFDPRRHRAVWPSTGNYCRGGVAISRILGCDGVAVLPEGMSSERYDWLEKWVADPAHIVRTVGTESNVKEIYDKCHELAQNSDNVILNQFSAFSNYMVHHSCTGAACDRVFAALEGKRDGARLAAFVSATGSAGTIAAGDYLKSAHGTRIAAVEALECPTMLENGYGEHNIQGIGDKHIPLIHNVMNTDFIIGVSDRVTDRLNVLFNSDTGRACIARQTGLSREELTEFEEIGLSGFANIVAAITLARHMNYGADDVIMTVATDSARMYGTEAAAARQKFFADGFNDADAEHVYASCLSDNTSNQLLETGQAGRRRIFNLGYYTWVEQQGVSIEDFDARSEQSFWQDIAQSVPAWDRLITEFNADVGLN